MKTPQQKLDNYMEAKISMLYEATGDEEFFDLYTEEDRADLMGWSDEDAKYTINEMNEMVDIGRDVDTKICPWCIRFYDDGDDEDGCPDCTFKKRHGYCNDDNESLYAKLVEKLPACDNFFTTLDLENIKKLMEILK